MPTRLIDIAKLKHTCEEVPEKCTSHIKEISDSFYSASTGTLNESSSFILIQFILERRLKSKLSVSFKYYRVVSCLRYVVGEHREDFYVSLDG